VELRAGSGQLTLVGPGVAKGERRRLDEAAVSSFDEFQRPPAAAGQGRSADAASGDGLQPARLSSAFRRVSRPLDSMAIP
jgi:hypothetical protein